MSDEVRLVPFSMFFSLGRGLNITKNDYKEEGCSCLSYGDVHSKYKGFVDASKDSLPKVSETFIKLNPGSLLQIGDIVFADTSEDYDGSGDATCVLNNENSLFAGYHTTIAKPKDPSIIFSPFYGYYFQTPHFRNQIIKQVNGIKVYSITNKILQSTKILLPSVNEQKEIVFYLDKQITKIESAIKRLQNLSSIIHSYRESLITRAVTKGIDPCASVRKSSLPNLGLIPESWNFIKLKYLARLNPKCELPSIGNVEYLPMENIHNGFFEHKNEDISKLPKGLNAFQNGDILLAKVTPCFENGNICIATEICNEVGLCSTEIFVLRPNKDIVSSEYLLLLLQNSYFKQEAKAYMRGTGGLKRIPANWFVNRKFILPPIRIQDEIVAYIKDFEKSNNQILDKIYSEIKNLQKYKQSLISKAIVQDLF